MGHKGGTVSHSAERSDGSPSPARINHPVSIPPTTSASPHPFGPLLTDSPGVHICSASLSNSSLWQLERPSNSSQVKYVSFHFISLFCSSFFFLPSFLSFLSFVLSLSLFLFLFFLCETLLNKPASSSLGEGASTTQSHQRRPRGPLA